jgi:hypothetical protein
VPQVREDRTYEGQVSKLTTTPSECTKSKGDYAQGIYGDTRSRAVHLQGISNSGHVESQGYAAGRDRSNKVAVSLCVSRSSSCEMGDVKFEDREGAYDSDVVHQNDTWNVSAEARGTTTLVGIRPDSLVRQAEVVQGAAVVDSSRCGEGHSELTEVDGSASRHHVGVLRKRCGLDVSNGKGFRVGGREDSGHSFPLHEKQSGRLVWNAEEGTAHESSSSQAVPQPSARGTAGIPSIIWGSPEMDEAKFRIPVCNERSAEGIFPGGNGKGCQAQGPPKHDGTPLPETAEELHQHAVSLRGRTTRPSSDPPSWPSSQQVPSSTSSSQNSQEGSTSSSQENQKAFSSNTSNFSFLTSTDDSTSSVFDIFAHTKGGHYYEARPTPGGAEDECDDEGHVQGARMDQYGVGAESGDDGEDEGKGPGKNMLQSTRRMNPLPTTSMDIQRLLLDNVCTDASMVIRVHACDDTAKATLAPMPVVREKSCINPPRLMWVARECVAAKNMEEGESEYQHTYFLRLKSDGFTYRLIVDGTAKSLASSFNSRLPVPPAPRAMMRIYTVLLVVMAGECIGVDDVRTAFPQIPLCETMRRALGIWIRTSGKKIWKLRCTRAIQGGTWSAALCQAIVLWLVYGERLVGGTVRVVDWFRMCVENGSLVHVDDVVSSGLVAAELDGRRLRFREWSSSRYGVIWKEHLPSGTTADALGLHMNVRDKVWRLRTEWIESCTEALAAMIMKSLNEHAKQWLAGIAVWICQALHLPMAVVTIMRTNPQGTIRPLMIMLRGSAYHRHRCAVPSSMLGRWPRSRRRRYVISDASCEGWSGSTQACLGRAGRWSRCAKSGWITTEPCCGEQVERIEPAEVYYGEALASCDAIVHNEYPDEELLVVTDSMIWKNALVRNHSSCMHMAALIVLVYLIRLCQTAAAHIPGLSNPADEASHSAIPFVATEELHPTTGIPEWTLIGWSHPCQRTAMAMWVLSRKYIPCAWRDIGDRAVSKIPRCKPGHCLH